MGFFSRLVAETPVMLTIYEFMRGLIIFLNLTLLGIILFSINRTLKYRPKLVYDPRKWQRHIPKKKKSVTLATPAIAAAWEKVQKRLRDGSADAMRLAVVEGDGVVDEVLRRMNLPGQTFAERLSNLSPDRHSGLDKVWDAHRLRNNLVHTPDFSISATKAEEAVDAYESFLREVKAL